MQISKIEEIMNKKKQQIIIINSRSQIVFPLTYDGYA